MELGTMGLPWEEARPYIAELGLKWCGVGVEFADAIAQDSCDKARALGLEPIGEVNIVPSDIHETMFFHDFGRRLRDMAKRLPIYYYEIWPEPSCPYVNRFGLGLVDYTNILKCAYENIKEVNPTIEVWNGGMGQHGTMWNLEAFLWQCAPFMDALNFHPFQFDANPARVVDLMSGLMARGILVLEEMNLRKKLVVTEWGYPTSNLGTVYGSFVDALGVPGIYDEHQAWITEEVLEMCDPIIEVFQFALLLDIPDSTHWGANTGLRYTAQKPKPAYELVKEWAARKRGIGK